MNKHSKSGHKWSLYDKVHIALFFGAVAVLLFILIGMMILPLDSHTEIMEGVYKGYVLNGRGQPQPIVMIENTEIISCNTQSVPDLSRIDEIISIKHVPNNLRDFYIDWGESVR